jgi:hypothetical protein
MRHARYGILLLESILFLHFSCFAQFKQRFLDEPYRASKLSVPLAVTEIEIADSRASVAVRSIKAPKFTFRQKGDTIIPPLTIEQEKVVRDEIRQSVTGGGPQVRIKATLKEGIKVYTLGFFHAREYATAAVTIELRLDTARATLFSTTGEANYEVKSMTADSVYLETLYRKALKTAVYKAFESVGEFMRKRANEEIPGNDGTAEPGR